MSSDFDINLLAISSPSFRITPRPRYPEIAVARTRRLFRSFFDPHASSLEMSGSPRQLPSNQRMSRRPVVGRGGIYKRRPHRGGEDRGVTLQIVHDWVAKVNARGSTG